MFMPASSIVFFGTTLTCYPPETGGGYAHIPVKLIEDAEFPVAWRDPFLHAPLGFSIVFIFSQEKKK
jgi:hypothetical protein